MFRLTILFLTIAFYSCGQNKNEHTSKADVKGITDKIFPLVKYMNNPDSSRKALALLDSSTVLDSTCFLCHYDKIMFLNSLKEYKKAIATLDILIMLKPKAHDLYLTKGIFYEKLNDTLSSKKSFQRSLELCDVALAEKNIAPNESTLLETNKALNLVFLNRKPEADLLLKHLCENEKDDDIKQDIKKMIDQNKEQILHKFLNLNN